MAVAFAKAEIFSHPSFRKALVAVPLLSLAVLAPGATGEAVRGAMADAYVQVSTFVAFTLAIFYTLEHVLKLDTDYLLKKYERWQVPIAAFMGILPGCGGAIIVITQYVSGRLGFGAMVAVLTATMGDAAFLLLAQDPKSALIVHSVLFTSAVICGYLVELIHGRDFLRKKHESEADFTAHCQPPAPIRVLHWPWLVLIVPGFALGIGGAMQLDTDLWFGALAALHPTHWTGCAGAMLCIFMWALNPNAGPAVVNLSGRLTETVGWKTHLDRVIIDTNFVTVWVVAAFLTFELTILWTGADLAALFGLWGPLVPLMAVLIGFIPGCGPQILVTTFFLNGIVPLSAQLGNAISNDGDALFPAIALAPKTAILATLYTAVPAVIVSYGWYFLAE